MTILCVGGSDIGRKRKTNQDSICLYPNRNFFAVADGMGGHNGGDIASQSAVATFPVCIESFAETEDPKTIMEKCISEANKNIFEQANREVDLKGMGTTVTAIMFTGQQLFIGNVGDSRTYMIHNKMLYQLSKDHSLVQEKLNLGIYSREDALKDKMKNVLVRSVGFEEKVEVDTFNYKVCKNDVFLLSSDGLHSKVADGDILDIINHHIPDPAKAVKENVQEAVQALINKANENGGEDNISVIIAIAQ